jgi:hypothetical protein
LEDDIYFGFGLSRSANLHSSLFSFHAQLHNLGFEAANVVACLFVAGLELAETTFALPQGNLSSQVVTAAPLGVDLLACAATLSGKDSLIDQSQAAGFANAVLLVALAAQVSPLPAFAVVSDAVVEAHFEWLDSNCVPALALPHMVDMDAGLTSMVLNGLMRVWLVHTRICLMSSASLSS